MLTCVVNLKGTFLTARAFVPSMVEKKRGRFVAIGSISSTLGTARQSAYCAAKWGIVGFVKSLAEEVRGSGVQAMCVLPGSVDTEMLAGSGFAAQMTAEQACSGDAQRLCGQFIPDRQTTGACMARLRSQLSPACAAFFKPAKSTRKSPRHRRHS